MAFPTSIELTALDGIGGFIINGSSSSRSGGSVSAAGDVDGDGIGDFVIGASDAGGGGASYVIFGREGIGSGGPIDLASLAPSDGFAILGITVGDASGASVSAGDVNGDGVSDLIIGAPTAIDRAGESYVVFGDETLRSIGNLELADLDGTNGFVINAVSDGELSGGSVSAAGDVNGDTVGDLIIGAIGTNSYAGAGYVVFGDESLGSGGSLDLATLVPAAGFVIAGPSADAYSSQPVSAAGDVNGDGFDDLIIGTNDTNSTPGTTYVVFGGDALVASPIELSSFDPNLNPAIGFAIKGVSSNDASGFSASAAGDVNGDTIDDLIIGAPYAHDDRGASYVVFGSAGLASGGNLDLASLDGTNGFVIQSVTDSERGGFSVGAAGDVNGDGIGDLIIGEPGPKGGVGRSYVVFGGGEVGSGGTLDLASLDGTNGFVMTGDMGSFTGASVSAAGDVNADGAYDVIVGAPGMNSTAGASYVVFGEAPPVVSPPPPFLPPLSPPEPNRAPVAGDDQYTTPWGAPLTVPGPGLLANDADADGNPLTVTGLVSGPEHGVLTWSADGGFTYTLNVEFAGTDGFSYTIGDGHGGSDTATVTIDITDADAPRPRPDVSGGAGDEHFWGTNQVDEIRGMGGDDTIDGDGGRDTLNGNGGDDVVNGEGDEDLARGGQGDDWVLGGAGNDTVHGDLGNDQVWGGRGNDQVFGDAGDDVLTGDRGNDALAGGDGADQFAFGDASGLDRVTDFDLGGGDLIRLEAGPDGLINGVAIGGFADILSRLVDGPNGAILQLGDGNSITISGVAKAQFAPDDFLIA